MKHGLKVVLFVFIAAGLSLNQSCTKDELVSGNDAFSAVDPELKKADKLRTFYGPATPVGNGVGRAWVKEDAAGNPVEAGLTLSEKALEKLPHHHAGFVFPFHKNKGGGFYDHVLLDWAPEGHEPEEIYGIPHFDVHFYTISVEEREAIQGSPDPDLVPDGKYIPQDYNMMPGIVPQMGAHWVDFSSPEIAGFPDVIFTYTFIWGSYLGEFVFMEPMITRDFLLSLMNQPGVTAPVKQPQAWQKDGWYPSGYKIEWTDKPSQYNISLTGLSWSDAE